jgi:methanogenic corrinoid protein MtbC1
MREIGDAWDCGDTSVAEEHRATGLAYEILTLLRDALPGTSPRGADAPRVMMLCPAGEEHALPARMAAERFVDAGWRVDYLGANVPAGEAVRQAERTRPSALGISVTTAADGARALLRELDASRWKGPILLGGALAEQVAQGMPNVLIENGTDDLVARVATQVRGQEATHP